MRRGPSVPVTVDGGTVADGGPPPDESALAVFRNRPFLLLWLAQAATQIGGNMVIFGLTVIIVEVDRLDDRRQRPDPDVPRAGGPLLGRSPASSSTASTGGSS